MYDVDKTSLESSLTSANPTVFTKETVDLILNLVSSTSGSTGGTSNPVTIEKVVAPASGEVTVASGTQMVQIGVAEGQTTKVDVPANLPVIVFESATGGVDVTLKDTNVTVPSGTKVAERVVVTGGGNNNIVVADAKNTKIVTGAGNDTIKGGTGSDIVVAGGGNKIVDGGTGFDVVQVKTTTDKVQVDVKTDGTLQVKIATGDTVDLKNVQYVALDNGDAIIAAQDTVEAAVATLYKSILGRTAEADGLKDWFALAHNGWTLTQIAQGFVDSTEGHNKVGSQSNDEFLAQLYQNNFGRTADAEGFAFWKAALEHGVSRADVAHSFAQVAAQNLAGTVQSENITTIGIVKVIDGNV